MAAEYHYGVKLRITPTGLSPASAAASLAALPQPALPGVFSPTGLSATLTARPLPHGIPVGACTPPTGLPVLLPSPSSMRAAATTPAEPTGAFVVRFPPAGSLPRETGGSASALLVSRPARRSLALRPAWSLSRPRRPFCRSASNDVVTSIIRSDCFRLERQFTGRDSHPLGGWCLCTAHCLSALAGIASKSPTG